MNAVAAFFAHIPHEVRRVGGSLPLRLVVFAVALVLNIGFYVPSIPSGIPGGAVPGLDKVVHVLVFALTVWSAGRVLAPRRRFPMGWVVITAVAHAGLIELVQLALLPDRGAETGDLVADLIGIGLGLGLWVGERLRAARRFSVPE